MPCPKTCALDGRVADRWHLRRKLVAQGDEAHPIGVWVNGWDAGDVTAIMVAILIEAAFMMGSLSSVARKRWAIRWR